MKKIIITLLLISTICTLSAQNDTGKIAAFPFTGKAVGSVEDGEFYAGLFTSQFVSMGYTLVTRTAAIETAMQEINYQSSGMTGEVVEIGKQLSADYVLIGTVGQISNRYNIRVEVIGVETSEIAASDTQVLTSIEDLFDKNLITQIVARLNMQILGTVGGASSDNGNPVDMPSLGGLNVVEELKIDYEKAVRGEKVGKGLWISGIVSGGLVLGAGLVNELFLDGGNGAVFLGVGLSAGALLIIPGIIVDSIHSGRQNTIEETLRRDYGIQMSFAPIIQPEYSMLTQNVNWNIGASVKFAL